MEHFLKYILHLFQICIYIYNYILPPKRSNGTVDIYVKNLTHSPCPFIERLKHPSLSPDKLSAPHYKITAYGLYLEKISKIIGLKINSND